MTGQIGTDRHQNVKKRLSRDGKSDDAMGHRPVRRGRIEFPFWSSVTGVLSWLIGQREGSKHASGGENSSTVVGEGAVNGGQRRHAVLPIGFVLEDASCAHAVRTTGRNDSVRGSAGVMTNHSARTIFDRAYSCDSARKCASHCSPSAFGAGDVST